jgi:hypothetical protein
MVTGVDAPVAAPPRRWGAITVVLGAGLCALVFGAVARDDVLRFFHADYREQVSALLEQGQTAAALDALEQASLIDADRVAMLDRLLRRSEAAGLDSVRTALAPFRARSDLAELRFRIGRALLAELGDGRNLSAAQRDLFDRAIENAKLLVALEPDAFRAHFLLGLTQLVLWTSSGNPSARWEARAHLERAVAIKPEHAGARSALQQADLPRT